MENELHLQCSIKQSCMSTCIFTNRLTGGTKKKQNALKTTKDIDFSFKVEPREGAGIKREQNTVFYCLVPENIHNPPHKGNWKFQGRELSETKTFKEMYRV